LCNSCHGHKSGKILKGTDEARVRAKTATTARWKNHVASKPLADAIAELEKTMRNLRRKLEVVAFVSGEPYSALVPECLNDVALVLRA
jgi:hypothetical protein